MSPHESSMSTSTYSSNLSLTPDFASLSLDSATRPADERWDRTPITLFKRDVFSRFVVFDGKREPYIEPHFVELDGSKKSAGRDPDFDQLVEARWCEYLAEGYLRSTGSKLTANGSGADETCIDTPVQLYLAHSRLARAQLEIKIYTKLLERGSGASFKEQFEHIKEQSLPTGGIFRNSCASAIRPIAHVAPAISI